MALKINKQTYIYVVCPASYASGGPLALHQLAYKLRKLCDANVYMYYLPTDADEKINPQYAKYKIPSASNVIDSDNNVLIIPEVMTEQLFEFNKIQKCIWWLSVDNFFNKKFFEKFKISLGLKNKYNFKNLDGITHFTQSTYAYNFIKSRKKDKESIYMLSDYLSNEFFEKETNLKYKEKIITYNPKKGYKFTRSIIELVPDYNWIPIQNMTPKEVKDLLNKSMLYIDFGNHPGKDRFPREAAISMCCIITNKKGSAGFKKDLPISEEFKFEENSGNLQNIKSKIKFLMENYISEIEKFEDYRSIIKGQEIVFENEIKVILADSYE